jgi:hypothetical protein
MPKQKLTIVSLISAMMSLIPQTLHAEEASDQNRGYYATWRGETGLEMGLFADEHRFGVDAYRRTGNYAYKAAGLQYGYHFNGFNQPGPYTKLYYEHRRFERDVQINERRENDEWKHDTLKNHTAHHVGALVGYQWFFCNPRTYAQIGFGWQYNSNPAKVTTAPFGVNRSIRARQEASGELGVGLLLK